MADQVHVSQDVPGPASEPSGGETPHQFGLTAAMALIVGSIIGVGIFNLPTSLAAYGPITLVSMALTTVGALALALLFAALCGGRPQPRPFRPGSPRPLRNHPSRVTKHRDCSDKMSKLV